MRGTSLLAWVGLALSCACAARGGHYAAGDAAEEPAAFPAVSTPEETADELGAYEARLRSYEESLRAEGVAVAGRGADSETRSAVDGSAAEVTPTDDARDDEGEVAGERARHRAPGAQKRARPDAAVGGLGAKERCQRICDLAHATCELADRICGLAGRHPGETRYEETCTRAEGDCQLATEACQGCAQ